MMTLPNGHYRSILKNIRKTGKLTRSDLSAQLGVGVSMVSKLVNELIDRELIREEGRVISGQGRPRDYLGLNPNAGFAVGLDVGGNHLRTVVVDFCGNIVAQTSSTGPEMSSRKAILDSFEASIDSTLSQCKITRKDVIGIGISLYGSVDPLNGTVYSWTETPGLYQIWKNFDIRTQFQKRWPINQVYIDDVVRTLGVAEVLYGSNFDEYEDFIYILADTGIGAALMIDRQPYVGPTQLSGELGHLPLNPERIPCNCGNLGCLETISSVNAIVNKVKERLNVGYINSPLVEIGDQLNINHILAAEKDGDTIAIRTLNEAGDVLGIGIGVLLNLIGVSRVVVGGILSTSMAYMESARRSVRMNCLSKVTQSLKFVSSDLDEYTAARGAASIVLNAIFQ